MTGPTERYCVVGAGPSGLTVAKNFRQAGIGCDVIESADEVGGNWYYGQRASSVYQSTHLISSKRLTEFTDFPMPADYPEYPSHVQAWEYLRSYARHFRLYEVIELNRSVEWIEPAGGGWSVRLSGGEVRQYAGVVIANGHHWDPRIPELPGSSPASTLHSSQYKTPDILRGRRVLVVGAGNSGCDIAVESAQNAAATFHSVRRGYHYLPKFLFGQPTDQCGERLLRWRLPLGLRRLLAGRAMRIALGRPGSLRTAGGRSQAVRDASDHQLANAVLRRSRQNPREARRAIARRRSGSFCRRKRRTDRRARLCHRLSHHDSVHRSACISIGREIAPGCFCTCFIRNTTICLWPD